MIEKRKPAHGGNRERATRMETGKETISSEYFTTSGPRGQGGKIFSLLLEGEQNALPAAHLAELGGYRDTRALRLEIDRERENSLILASDRGYFRPQPGDKGLAEIRAFVKRMDGRCASNRRATKKARAVLRELQHRPLDGQTDLWQGGNT